MPISNLKTKLEFYKSRIPTHGNNGTERPIWYGFPDLGSRDSWIGRKSYGLHNFHGIGGLRCAGYQNQCRESDSQESFLGATTGYYSDNQYCDVIEPLAFRLNHGRGFIPATVNSWGEVVIYPDVYESARGALRAAHRIAEGDAEEGRENDAEFQAGVQIEDLKTENQGLRKAIKSLISEFRAACPRIAEFPAIRDALQSSLMDSLAEYRKNRKRIAELRADYWLAVNN